MISANQIKVCSICNLEKDAINDFNKKDRNYRHSFCKSCQSAYNKEHYRKYKSYYIAKAKTRDRAKRKQIQDLIRMAKSVPCTDCKKSYGYWVMDFDHLPGEIKFKNIGDLVKFKTPLYKIEQEISKCEVVCSNCHRERTHNRKADISSA